MQNYILNIVTIGLVLLGFIGCGARENISSDKHLVTDTLKKTSISLTNSSIEKANILLEEIEQHLGSYAKEEKEDKIIEEINACAITLYQKENKSKQEISCFDGYLTLRKCKVYYLDGQPLVATIIIKKYNASPANLAEFDESKTYKTTLKLYFDNNDLNTFKKVLDSNNKEIETTSFVSKEWDILVQALN